METRARGKDRGRLGEAPHAQGTALQMLPNRVLEDRRQTDNDANNDQMDGLTSRGRSPPAHGGPRGGL
eukprot:1505026-Lingulodinium_polyedra.AAC.1